GPPPALGPPGAPFAESPSFSEVGRACGPLVEGPEEGCEANQRESGDCARKAGVQEAHSQTPVPDSRELLLRTEAEQDWKAALLHPDGERISVLHRRHVGRVARKGRGSLLYVHGS